ncbi:MAG: glycosyltransferase [Deltaproteobacteria bacterium]|nr:glycosyltransferase [Deltaproteobacteria bacterium]
MIEFSVIVPAYNAARTIDKCLGSLRDQTVGKGRYEVIVVDDGSTDSTPLIVKGYSVKCIRQRNLGPAAARNAGAREARGGIILFTDSDCVPESDWIKEMARPFADPSVSAVKGAYRTLQPGIVARFSQIEFEERFEMLKAAPSIDMVDTYSAAFRKEVFDVAGGFDTGFPAPNNEDTELSYRLSSSGHRMVFNPRAVVCHLNHPDSIKRYARLKFWRGYWRMVVYKRFPDKMLKDTYTPQTLKFQILAAMMIGACLPVGLLFPAYGLLLFVLAGGFFLALSTPFFLTALRKDPAVAVVSPALLFLRAVSIGLGALWGVARGGRK